MPEASFMPRAYLKDVDILTTKVCCQQVENRKTI